MGPTEQWDSITAPNGLITLVGEIPPTMRPRIKNMRESDQRILEFLYNGEQTDIIATPAVIAANVDYADGTIRERMKPIREAGLIAYHDENRGMYTIDDLGRKYIESQLSDGEIDQLEDQL